MYVKSDSCVHDDDVVCDGCELQPNPEPDYGQERFAAYQYFLEYLGVTRGAAGDLQGCELQPNPEPDYGQELVELTACQVLQPIDLRKRRGWK